MREDPDGLFLIAEIEINTHCNRSCGYCPNVLAPKNPRLIAPHVFSHVIQELERVSFSGRLSLHSYNEPLLHPELAKLVSEAHLALRHATIVIMTNGDFLSDTLYQELVKAGVSHFLVTAHSKSRPPSRPRQRIMYPQDHFLTNRGGVIGTTCRPCLDAVCLAPTEMLIVDIDANVLRCYEDFHRRHIIGNLLHTPVEEIWHNEEWKLQRANLRRGQRAIVGGICASCNNRNHETPEDLAELMTLGEL